MRTIYGPIYFLRPYERGTQEYLGKYSGIVLPGLGFQIPFIQIIRVSDLREHTIDIHPQPILTKDNVGITVDGVIWVRPTPSEEAIDRTLYKIDQWQRAVILLATANLRQAFSNLTLAESLITCEVIAANLQRLLNSFVAEWGRTVSKIEIRLIDPPEASKEAMHKQKAAAQRQPSMP
jgi:regulator of protease activity HflC (stomatin/prohibitin superfamily)